MKINYILTLLILSVININGQNSRISDSIEKLKYSGAKSENISTALIESNNVAVNFAVRERLKDIEKVYIFEYQPNKTKGMSHMINCKVKLENKETQLELIELPLSHAQYEIVTSSGDKYTPNPDIKHYRGVITGDSTSFVAMTFFGDKIQGLIANKNGNYNITYDKGIGKHLVYNESNLEKQSSFTCETRDDYMEVYDPQVLLQEYRVANEVSHYKYVRLYLETEFDVFQELGNVQEVEAFITGLFNQMATIYQNDDIWISLSQLFIWNTMDPYTGTDTDVLLAQFKNNRTSINGDLGQLITFRIGGGQAAGNNGLSSSNVRDKLSVIGIDTNVQEFPVYSWAVKGTTHEFGHLLGSRHTHACVWNGNNTAIDGCWETEEDCPQPAIPSIGGTIMSYCQHQPVGINFNLGFGLQPGNVIRNKIYNASGLNSVQINGPTLVNNTGATYTLTGATASSWQCGANVQLISSNSNSATFKSTGTSESWISVTLNTGVVGPTIIHKVWSGKPIIERIDGPNRTPNGQYATFRAIYNSKCSPTSFQWILNPQNGNSVYGATTSILDVAFYNAGSYQLVVRASNECGMGEYTTSGVNVYNANGRSYIAYPNPASQTLYVDFSSIGEQPAQAFSSTAVEQKHYDVRLFNLQGALVRTAQSAGERISLDVSGLPGGNYFLHIYDGKGEKPVVQQVIVSH